MLDVLGACFSCNTIVASLTWYGWNSETCEVLLYQRPKCMYMVAKLKNQIIQIKTMFGVCIICNTSGERVPHYWINRQLGQGYFFHMLVCATNIPLLSNNKSIMFEEQLMCRKCFLRIVQKTHWGSFILRLGAESFICSLQSLRP